MLNPLLLWFLPLALVPIILHLITLYRLKTVELSTYRFLMDSYIQQRRKIKLLEFLLMLLRTAFVALIIITLSRPVLEKYNFFGGRSGRDIVIVIDASTSMSARTGGTTSLERAKSAAKSIVSLLGQDDRVMVIRAEEKPEVLVSRFAGQNQPIIDLINQVAPGSGGSNIASALEEAFNTNRKTGRVIYVLTDGSRRAWASVSASPALKAIGSENQLVVMNVGPQEPIRSIAVLGDPPKPIQAVAGLPVMLSASVANTSPDRPADTVLSVYLDEEQVHQTNLTMTPGQKVVRPVTVVPTRSGLVLGRLQVPTDAFPEDDVYRFCLNVEPRLQVLVVSQAAPPKPGQAAGSSTSAENAELFIKAALTSPLTADAPDVVRGAAPTAAQVAAADARKIAASLQVTCVAPAGMTDGALAAADVVILANVPLDAASATRLQKYVSEGLGLFILPGASVTPETYTPFFKTASPVPTPGSLAGPRNRKGQPIAQPPKPGAPATPAVPAPEPARWVTLGVPSGDPDNEATFLPVTGIDTTHPILSAFSEGGSDFFATTRIYRHFAVNVPKLDPESQDASLPVAPAQVLMRLPDRSPALIETRIGDGRVLVAGFPATPDWSNVPLKPEFVPIMLRSVAHLRRAASVTAPAYVNPHDPAPIHITDRWTNAQVECVDPSGKPHAVKLTRAGRQFVGAFTDTDKTGVYRFKVLPRTPGAPERVEMGFAVNLNLNQSDFTMLTEQQIHESVRPLKISYLRGSTEDPDAAGQLRQKREIWRYLIWAMFAVIGLEFLLATLRPGGKEEAKAHAGGVVVDQRKSLGRLRRAAGSLGKLVGSNAD